MTVETDEVVERVARAIWNTSQDHIVGNTGTYALKMRMSWDEATRAARGAISSTRMDELQSEIDTLRKALGDVREAVASLDIEALGVMKLHPSGDLDNGYAYSIRDELLCNIDNALQHNR